MYELEIPNGVNVEVNGEVVTVKGRLGSAARRINTKFVRVSVNGNKLVISGIENKKLARKSGYAAKALEGIFRESMNNVENGIEKKLKVLFAHFPASIEIKGKSMYLKNLFGEKVPREISIVGATKIEVKGQDVTIKGVDKYEVGQTIANIRRGCYARGYDTRVFQDGLYVVTEE